MTVEVCAPIYVGTSVRITGEFTDLDDNPADTTAKLIVEDPAGVETQLVEPALSHPGLGSYFGVVSVPLSGEYAYRWEGSGALIAAWEGRFYVRESRLS